MAQLDKFIQFQLPTDAGALGGRVRIRASDVSYVQEGKVLAERRGHAPQREIAIGLRDGTLIPVVNESMESVWRLLKGASDGNTPQVFIHDPNDMQHRHTMPMQHPDIEAAPPPPTTPAAEPEPTPAPAAQPAPTHIQTGRPPLKGPSR